MTPQEPAGKQVHGGAQMVLRQCEAAAHRGPADRGRHWGLIAQWSPCSGLWASWWDRVCQPSDSLTGDGDQVSCQKCPAPTLVPPPEL